MNEPEVGGISPARIRSRVVLPEPEGPSTQTNSRGYTSKEIFSNACSPPLLSGNTTVQVVDGENGGLRHNSFSATKCHKEAQRKTFVTLCVLCGEYLYGMNSFVNALLKSIFSVIRPISSRTFCMFSQAFGSE